MYKPVETCCLCSRCRWVTRNEHASWKSLSLDKIFCKKKAKVYASQETLLWIYQKHHKLVHHLLNSLGGSKTCNAGYCASIFRSLYTYRSRSVHGSLIPKPIFRTHRKSSLATRLCPCYYLNCTQNEYLSSNCAHLCRKSSLSLVYHTCTSFPSSPPPHSLIISCLSVQL